MARTYRARHYHQEDVWDKPGRGKYYKRMLNKAIRRAVRGTGKARSVARLTSEVTWKGT